MGPSPVGAKVLLGQDGIHQIAGLELGKGRAVGVNQQRNDALIQLLERLLDAIYPLGSHPLDAGFTVEHPWAKATVRRITVGLSRSSITTLKPALCRRSATPVAMSPEPRITTS